VAAPIVSRIRVRYHECDPQGVVFNANYFAYFDMALTEAWRELFGGYTAMVEGGVDCVVAEASARFRAGARFDDELELRWWVSNLGTTSMSTRVDVVRDGETLVAGELRHVFVRAGSTEKIEIPEAIRAGLEPHVLAAGAPV
jgi:acyl-CoA thioester hydrolase